MSNDTLNAGHGRHRTQEPLTHVPCTQAARRSRCSQPGLTLCYTPPDYLNTFQDQFGTWRDAGTARGDPFVISTHVRSMPDSMLCSQASLRAYTTLRRSLNMWHTLILNLFICMLSILERCEAGLRSCKRLKLVIKKEFESGMSSQQDQPRLSSYRATASF